MSVTPPVATFLIVGDLHRHWRPADRDYLERSGQDLAMFVGDLGDEDVELVEEVAAIPVAKAVILGNHDAWQSFSRRRPTRRLERSLEALEGDHLAYGVREVPSAGVSVIGARPFSWGGDSLRSPEVYSSLYGISDMRASANRIFEAARTAQHRDLVILAHNGPTGLSTEPGDIYGKDFGEAGGDWGDPDLELAIDEIKRQGWRVPCVIAGHMHDRLLTPPGGRRLRFVRHDSTLYVNPAVVPRVRRFNGTTIAHFLRMVWSEGVLQKLDEIWVDTGGRISEVVEPEILER